MPETWLQFRELIRTADDLDVARLVEAGCATDLDESVLDAYRAPFPDEDHLAGVRALPDLVPTEPDHPAAAPLQDARETLSGWAKPAFVLFSADDPITRPSRDDLRDLLPRADDQPDLWVEDAAHFLQEDAGERVAEHVVDFVDRTERGS
jgi:haloalkane dehalogenase